MTQPADFRAYLLEQLEPLVSEYGATIEVGVGAQEIPYPYVIESGDELTRGGADAAELARYFPVPSLATIGDETADGEFVHAGERPLALFDAPRVDYSLRRLVHYTGSDWRAMQPWVLLTNYHRYVDQFVHWGLKQLHSGAGVEKVILPGNVVIDRSLSPRGGGSSRRWRCAWHRFQMPAYHLVRADGRGVSLVNIGVGPANAKNITDHIAVLRPHCWLMVGHCAGLRQSQLIGDYVLAHAYLRRDNILDDAVPLMMPIPAIAEVQVALQEAVAKVTGEPGRRAEAPAAHRHGRHQRRPQLGTALVEGAPPHQHFARHRRRHGVGDHRDPGLPHARALRHAAVRLRQAAARRDQAARRRQRLLRARDRRASADRPRGDRPPAEHRRLAALAQAPELRRAAVPVRRPAASAR